MPVRHPQTTHRNTIQPLVLTLLAASSLCVVSLAACTPSENNSTTVAAPTAVDEQVSHDSQSRSTLRVEFPLPTAGDTQVSQDNQGPAAPQEDDSPAVQVQVADLDLLQEIVASLAGKVVVIDIWSTSCAPCMLQFPHLVELSRSGKEPLACISFNVDYIGLKSKSPEVYLPKVAEFLHKQQATFTNLLSATSDENVLTHFKLESIPAILIYGPDGTLQHTLTDVNSGDDGLTYAGDVIPKVEALLSSAN